MGPDRSNCGRPSKPLPAGSPSVTNFCLIDVADGAAVINALRAKRIAVRHAASFPGLGAGHLRITARDPERNAALVAALAEALA